jgi:TM2 domain-containing membrane protein YozV
VKNSLKGALLSGLVFPGLGQLVLKRYGRGVALMLIVMAGLFVIIRITVRQAYAVLEKINAAGGAADTETITRAAAQAATPHDTLIINLVTLLLIVCWLAGIIDAYRIGKRRDREMAAGRGDGR